MELTEIENTVTSLDEAKQLIRELVAINQSLQEEDVAVLKTTIESLQSRHGSSSRNSSKAPSTDSPEQRAERKKQTKPSRKKGHSQVTRNTSEPPYQKIKWTLSIVTFLTHAATVVERFLPIHSRLIAIRY